METSKRYEIPDISTNLLLESLNISKEEYKYFLGKQSETANRWTNHWQKNEPCLQPIKKFLSENDHRKIHYR